MAASPQKIPYHPGYRMLPSGVIQSCWKFTGHGRGQTPSWNMSQEWRDMACKPDSRGRSRVKLRRSDGTYKWADVEKLKAQLFPARSAK